MARFKAFIEGSGTDGAVGGVSVHRKASEITIGVNGKRAGVEVEASVEEGTDSDCFRLYATRGTLAATRVYLGSVLLQGGKLVFQKGTVPVIPFELRANTGGAMSRLTPQQCREAARDFINGWFTDVSPPHPEDLTVERVSEMLKDAMFEAWKDGYVKALTTEAMQRTLSDPKWRGEE